MKKIALLFSLIVLLTACGSEGGDSSNVFTSDISIDQDAFNPNKGFYGINEQVEGDLHREMYFRMERETGNNETAVLQLNIFIPFSMGDAITGTYDFGIGTSDDLLVNASYSKGDDFYSIIGETVHITDLGDSKFRFEFTNMQALYVNNNFEERAFGGMAIEGEFVFEEN